MTKVLTNSQGKVYVASGKALLATGGSDTIPNYQIVSGVLTKRTNTYNLTGTEFSGVTSIGSTGCQYAFQGCYKLQTINFDSLKTTSFGNVNAFNNMFNSNTGSEATGGCTVHFPSNLQSTISGLTGYPTFGGSSSYINLAFDLPATS